LRFVDRENRLNQELAELREGKNTSSITCSSNPPSQFNSVTSPIYFSDSFFDIIIPFITLNPSSTQLYLNVFRNFIGPYLGIFSDDLSYFHYFPFKAKEMVLKIKNDYNKSENNKVDIRLSKFEQLSLHYWDALHMQFFCIMALSAKALGFVYFFLISYLC
jgi:hypothetical protein